MRNTSNAQNWRSNGSCNPQVQDIEIHHSDVRSSLRSDIGHNLNFTQEQIKAALFNSNSPSYSVQPTMNPNKHYQNHELHMAEILVESTNGQQRSAFQFDTITPKKKSPMTKPAPNCVTSDYNDAPLSSVMLDSGIEVSQASSSMADKSTKENANHKVAGAVSTLESESSSSDDNGGFVTPEDQEKDSKSHRVKRTTVVGNPMFSQSQDNELGRPGESLGLDDLEMDYDQIMNYFDNLKVN